MLTTNASRNFFYRFFLAPHLLHQCTCLVLHSFYPILYLSPLRVAAVADAATKQSSCTAAAHRAHAEANSTTNCCATRDTQAKRENCRNNADCSTNHSACRQPGGTAVGIVPAIFTFGL